MYVIFLIDSEDSTHTLLEKTINELSLPLQYKAVNKASDLRHLKGEENKPDIVVIDSGRANKDLITLRQELGKEDVKIIVLNEVEEYALDAFRYGVFDYLLKPIQFEEFCNSLLRMIDRLNLEQLTDQELQLLTGSSELLAIASASQMEFIELSKIQYCESKGRYSLFTMEDGTQKVSTKNLGFYELLLTGMGFYRIHHKIVVNLGCIAHIKAGRNAICVLKSGTELTISKRKFEQLRRFLKLK